ncbi:hypothetical protein OROHE_027148 [Orobanche hederae]
MASKTVLIVLACFLLINTKVSSAIKEEFLTEGITLAPTSSPLIYMSSPPPPSSSPLVATTPPPPLPPVVKAPPPHSAVILTPPPPPAPPISILAPPPVVKPPRNKEVHPTMRYEVQKSFKEEHLLKSLLDLLREMQMCASRTIWQQRNMWHVLRTHDDSRREAQVPLRQR